MAATKPSDGLARTMPCQSAVLCPDCRDCGVPMTLVKIVCHITGNPRHNREHFKCTTCDAVAILPPLYD